MNRIIQLDAVCYEDEGVFVAHCLQLDLVTTSSTVHQAFLDMQKVVKAQIRYALEHDNMENLFKPAPNHIWQMYAKAKLVDKEEMETLDIPHLPPHEIYQFQRLCAQ